MLPRIRVVDGTTGLGEDELRALIDRAAAELGVRRVEDEGGGRIEFAPAGEPVAEITSGGVLRPVAPNALTIGTPENYVYEVVTANVTIPSRKDDKENVREVSEDEARQAPLPRVIKYRRKIGRQREEMGFELETAPDVIKAEGGIDLKALVALLVLRVQALEHEVAELRNAVKGRGAGGNAP
ncbi:MAG: hypothetical protein QXP43_00600 [Nitrososphaerota archaeon]